MIRISVVICLVSLASAISAAGLAKEPTRHTSTEWAKLLDGGANRISSCSPADVYPGDRITIAFRGQDRGDQVRIDGARFQDAAVVVFRSGPQGANGRVRNQSINRSRSITLDVDGLQGLPIDSPQRARRIFREPGEYVIMSGYQFLSDEEGLIQGLCVVRYHAAR